MPESTVGAVAKAFVELIGLIKELKPTEYEKLKKELEDDQKKIGKAWKEGDLDTVNLLFDKYYKWLFEI